MQVENRNANQFVSLVYREQGKLYQSWKALIHTWLKKNKEVREKMCFIPKMRANSDLLNLKIKGVVSLVKARHNAYSWERAAHAALPEHSLYFFFPLTSGLSQAGCQFTTSLGMWTSVHFESKIPGWLSLVTKQYLHPGATLQSTCWL